MTNPLTAKATPMLCKKDSRSPMINPYRIMLIWIEANNSSAPVPAGIWE